MQAALFPFVLICSCCASSMSGSHIAPALNVSASSHDSAHTLTNPDAVALSIEISQPPPRTGSRLNICFRFRNMHVESVWIDSDLGVSGPAPGVALWMDVTDLANGKTLAWHCSGSNSAREQRPPNYVLLKPGEEYSIEGRLECFLPAQAGRVRMVARYRDSSHSPPKSTNQAVWFAGELVSNTVVADFVEIEQKPAAGVP
jgi:hypothetical protein